MGKREKPGRAAKKPKKSAKLVEIKPPPEPMTVEVIGKRRKSQARSDEGF
jgi:hypothetical protein